MKIEALLHATFLVADLEKSRAFYEGLLELRPDAGRPDLGFPGVWYAIGAKQQIHLMQLPNPEAGLEPPKYPLKPQQHAQHGGRDRHVALAVDDLEALALRLDSAHIAYTRSRSGRAALFCRDPDGNALEFVEVVSQNDC